jgi:hypothetical protein
MSTAKFTDSLHAGGRTSPTSQAKQELRQGLGQGGGQGNEVKDYLTGSPQCRALVKGCQDWTVRKIRWLLFPWKLQILTAVEESVQKPLNGSSAPGLEMKPASLYQSDSDLKARVCCSILTDIISKSKVS